MFVSLQNLVMEFNLLTDSEPRSPALSLSDAGTPQHEQGCKGQDNSGQFTPTQRIFSLLPLVAFHHPEQGWARVTKLTEPKQILIKTAAKEAQYITSLQFGKL